MNMLDNPILNGRWAPGDPLELGKIAEYFSDDGQRPREIDIVAVEPAENFARRLREAFIDCVVLTFVLTVLEIAELRLVFSDDLNAVVGAVAVDDNVFEIRIILHQHGPEGCLD